MGVLIKINSMLDNISSTEKKSRRVYIRKSR